MKRFAGILLLLCFTAPISCYFLYLKYEKYCIKKATKHFLIHRATDEELVLLTFSKVESEKLEWEHQEEFKYRGEMYDVVRKLTSKDSITYICYHDEPESLLSKKIAHLVKSAQNNNPQDQETHQRIFDFLKTCYFNCFPVKQYIVAYEQKSKFAYHQLYSSYAQNLEDPPPQLKQQSKSNS